MRQWQPHQDLVFFNALLDLEPAFITAALAQVIHDSEFGAHPSSRSARDPFLQAFELCNCHSAGRRVLEELFLDAMWVVVPPAHGHPLLEMRLNQTELLTDPEQKIRGAIGEQYPKHIVAKNANVFLKFGRLFVLENNAIIILLALALLGWCHMPIVVDWHRPSAYALRTFCHCRTLSRSWRATHPQCVWPRQQARPHPRVATA
mmetsp:Transcript_412/g.915  ORF Transcript_412/g.915 Transcript_412/m.915 type:complete len:204 (+) Transcript_412:220-831(+)